MKISKGKDLIDTSAGSWNQNFIHEYFNNRDAQTHTVYANCFLKMRIIW